jgi:nicotinamidase-related amidase
MCHGISYSIFLFSFPGLTIWFWLFLNESEDVSCIAPDCLFREKRFLLNQRVYGDGNLHRVAIIVIDMWNWHWCMTMSERVSCMVPRMNAILRVARSLGMQVIWNPSEVAQFHSGSTPHAKGMSVERHSFPSMRPSLPVQFTAPIGPCLCGPGFACPPYDAWDGMEPNLVIDDRDLFSVNGADIYNLLSERGITTIIFMGAATNMCVFKKPGAMNSMFQAGFNCVLAKDLSDAFTKYDPGSKYTPDSGAAETARNYAAAGIRIIDLGDDF